MTAIWEYQSIHQGNLPNDSNQAAELESIANSILSAADIDKQVLSKIPTELIEYVVLVKLALQGKCHNLI